MAIKAVSELESSESTPWVQWLKLKTQSLQTQLESRAEDELLPRNITELI